MQFYNRAVYFNKNICVGIGCGGEQNQYDYMLVIPLPSDHYDFIGPLFNKLKGSSLQEVINLCFEPKKFLTTEKFLGF